MHVYIFVLYRVVYTYKFDTTINTTIKRDTEREGCTYIYIYIYVCVYIYIYIERERKRDKELASTFDIDCYRM